MSSVTEIESAIEKLPLPEKQAIRDWLEDLIEDQLEITGEFRGEIQNALEETRAGIYSRVRSPDQAE